MAIGLPTLCLLGVFDLLALLLLSPPLPLTLQILLIGLLPLLLPLSLPLRTPRPYRSCR